jgi:hypothetical protein
MALCPYLGRQQAHDSIYRHTRDLPVAYALPTGCGAEPQGEACREALRQGRSLFDLRIWPTATLELARFPVDGMGFPVTNWLC